MSGPGQTPGAQRAAGEAQPRPVRLNPFSFSSNTDFFFALLVAAILGTSAYIFQVTVYTWALGTNAEFLRVAQECTAAGQAAFTSGAQSLDGIREYSLAMNSCMFGFRRQQALGTSAGLAVELLAAGLIYWLYPRWKIRRQKLVPVTREEYGGLVDVLETLARQAGLERVPRFYVNPFDLSRSGQAFGRAGEYAVYLPLGLAGELLAGSREARAVVLHELAHIKNADIDKTYLTVALWYAFLITALAPFIVWVVMQGLSYALDTLWRTTILVVMVLGIRNAVLRSREYYADLRAGQVEPARRGLHGALRMLPVTGTEPATGGGLAGAARALWAGLARVHPSAAQRLAVLEQPGLLFHQPLWVALAAGMVFAVGYDSLSLFLQNWDSLHLERMSLLAALIFSPLVVGVIGLGIWRSEVARKLAGAPAPNLWRMALALSAGVFVGRWVSLLEYISRRASPLTLLDRAAVVFFDFLWVGLLAVILYLFLRWVSSGASTWLELALRRPSPRGAYLAGLAAASLVLALVFGVIFYYIHLGTSAAFVGAVLLLFPTALVSYYLVNPLMLALLVLAWGFPLAALYWLNRVRAETDNRWALLDARLVVQPGQWPAPPLKRVLAGAALAGLACSLLLLALRAGAFAVLPGQVTETGGYRLGVFVVSALLTYPFQAVVGAWFAARARHMRLLTGQAAAFLTGLLCAGGLLLVNLALGGTLNLLFAWSTISYTAAAGQFASLPFTYLFSRRRQAAAAPARPASRAAAG